jgi:alpha-N-arabinofuranosidase
MTLLHCAGRLKPRAVLALVIAVVPLAACPPPEAEKSAVITVRLDETLGPIDPRIFGHFTEEVLTSYEGGISSELLFNRKFEMPEERTNPNLPAPLVTGAANGWEPVELDGSVTLALDRKVYFSPSQSQRITHTGGPVPAGVQQKGYRVVMPMLAASQRVDDPFHFKPGQRYRVRLAVKSQDLRGSVHVALGESYRKPVAHQAFTFAGSAGWKVYHCELEPSAVARGGKFIVYIDSPGTVWIDSVSMARADLDEDGLRKDVLEVTRRVKPTSIRWPGGCFVSDYNWRDGVGPVDQRPARWNRPWLAYYNNDVGVDEFLALCRKLGAEPYVCVNVGTGSPDEAAALVEYTNGGADTAGGRRRAANGHPQPYRVKTWNIGNEEYLPNIGSTRGKVYAEKFNAFVKAMRAVDPTIEFVACGAFDVPKGAISRENPAYAVLRYTFDWNQEVLPIAGRTMNYYSVHHYEPGDSAKGLSTDLVNRSALTKAEDLATKLGRLHKQMGQYVPGRKHIPIALDEWASWLPKEIPTDAALRPPPGLKKEADVGLYGATLSLREALAEAAVYNLMQRRPADFGIGNRTLLYAYALGLIGIGRDRVVESPPALMLELYSTREHCQSLRTEVNGPTFDVPSKAGFSGAKGAGYLDASARLRADGNAVDLFVVNRHLEKDLEATVGWRGKAIEETVEGATLNATTLTEWNTFEEPNRVKLESSQVRAIKGRLRHRFPAHSLTRFTVRLR